MKTEFSQQDIEQIIETYDLGILESFSPLSAGTVQTNFMVQTAHGKWILKYYENRSLESVRFEANVVSYIGKRDFPCALPIKNRQGRYVGVFQDKPYILFEYKDGHPVNTPNQIQREQIIHTAARLQVITAQYRPHLKQFRWNYSAELVRHLAHIEAQKIGTTNAHQKAKWFEKTLDALSLPSSLPKGICHCDYDPSNILFVGHQMTALLDFDDANYTYLLFDLVNLIDGWAWPFEGDLNLDFARQIVQTYLQGRPLSPVERNHLFDVHKLQILVDGIWFFPRGTASNFYERSKLAYLDELGRQAYTDTLFA